jgi:hypothetical protein
VNHLNPKEVRVIMDEQDIKTAIKEALKEEAKKTDSRPTDLAIFTDVLAAAVTGYAAKGQDMQGIISGSFLLARAVVGQCCSMGIARCVTQCTDGQWLGTGIQTPQVPGVQPPVQHQAGNQGIMTNQYPTPQQGQPQQYPTPGAHAQQYPTPMAQQQPMGGGQPAPGGMVAQYPTQSPVTHGGGVGSGVGQPTGNGWQAAVVGMYGPDGAPVQAPQQAPGVMTPHGMVPRIPVPQQQPQQGFAPQPGFAQQGWPQPQPGFAPQTQPVQAGPAFPQPIPQQPRIG